MSAGIKIWDDSDNVVMDSTDMHYSILFSGVYPDNTDVTESLTGVRLFTDIIYTTALLYDIPDNDVTYAPQIELIIDRDNLDIHIVSDRAVVVIVLGK